MSAPPRSAGQIPFDFHRNQSAVFETYYSAGNVETVAALRALVRSPGGRPLHIWGPPGTGKTHLLQALCHDMAAASTRALVYLPLREAAAHGPEICEGLETLEVVCIDDVDAVAGATQWEQALFALYNVLTDRARVLVTSARCAPRESPLQLADFRSRLEGGLIYQLQPLSEADKRMLLIDRARRRGLDLADGVAEFILRRQPRDTGSLCALIEQIDAASLSAHRHVTIPFVRELLEANQSG